MFRFRSLPIKMCKWLGTKSTVLVQCTNYISKFKCLQSYNKALTVSVQWSDNLPTTLCYLECIFLTGKAVKGNKKRKLCIKNTWEELTSLNQTAEFSCLIWLNLQRTRTGFCPSLTWKICTIGKRLFFLHNRNRQESELINIKGMQISIWDILDIFLPRLKLAVNSKSDALWWISLFHEIHKRTLIFSKVV